MLRVGMKTMRWIQYEKAASFQRSKDQAGHLPSRLLAQRIYYLFWVGSVRIRANLIT